MPTYNSTKDIPVRDGHVILRLGQKHPCIRNKRDDQGLEPWKIFSKDLKKKNIDVDPQTLREFVARKKKYMKEKLLKYIKYEKLSRRGVDEKIKKWDMYSSFEYHRKDIKDYEERLWAERNLDLAVNGNSSNAGSSSFQNTGRLSTPEQSGILYEIKSRMRRSLPVATILVPVVVRYIYYPPPTVFPPAF